MTRTEELLALAEACSPLPFDDPSYQCLAERRELADYVRKNPETIKQLIELVRLQNSELLFYAGQMDSTDEAIAAFERFERGVE